MLKYSLTELLAWLETLHLVSGFHVFICPVHSVHFLCWVDLFWLCDCLSLTLQLHWVCKDVCEWEDYSFESVCRPCRVHSWDKSQVMLWIQKEVKEMRGSLRCRDNRTLSLSSAMNVSQFKVHIHSHTSDRPPLGAIQACWCEVSQSCECVLVLLTRLYWLLNASLPVNWV